MANSPWTDSVTHQQDATAWVWNQIWDGHKALEQSEPVNAPDWSEFEVRLPDGTRVTVRVEIQP